MLRGQDFHFQLSGLGYNAVLTGIARDEPLLHRTVQGAVEHQVDAVDGGGTQSPVLIFSNMYSAALQ